MCFRGEVDDLVRRTSDGIRIRAQKSILIEQQCMVLNHTMYRVQYNN